MNVFISWSGKRSHAVAQAWYELLKGMFQNACDPFLSSVSIEAGKVWFQKIATELDKSNVGIICLTPENQKSPWILFESGALGKKIEASNVCTYLLELQPSEIDPPLDAFNANVAGKDGTRKVLETINKTLDPPLSDALLEKTFRKWYPDFEKALLKVPEPEAESSKMRKDRSLLQEILDLVRTDTQALAHLRACLGRPEDFYQKPPMKAWAKALEIQFEGGFLGGETRMGSTDMEHDTFGASPYKQHVSSLYWLSKGEKGKRISIGSELSTSLIGACSRETHERLMQEAPDDYGMQVYEVVACDDCTFGELLYVRSAHR